MLAPGPDSRTHVQAFVELQNVTHTYGRGDKEVRALDSTDLRIEKGDFIALVGPSGCGKSTILKLVTGLINASSGFVFVAGADARATELKSRTNETPLGKPAVRPLLSASLWRSW